MFITHFTGTAYCNEFSLASDDPGVQPFNNRFVEQYRLGRCKHTKVRIFDLLQALASENPPQIEADHMPHGNWQPARIAIDTAGRGMRRSSRYGMH